MPKKEAIITYTGPTLSATKLDQKIVALSVVCCAKCRLPQKNRKCFQNRNYVQKCVQNYVQKCVQNYVQKYVQKCIFTCKKALLYIES